MHRFTLLARRTVGLLMRSNQTQQTLRTTSPYCCGLAASCLCSQSTLAVRTSMARIGNAQLCRFCARRCRSSVACRPDATNASYHQPILPPAWRAHTAVGLADRNRPIVLTTNTAAHLAGSMARICNGALCRVCSRRYRAIDGPQPDATDLSVCQPILPPAWRAHTAAGLADYFFIDSIICLIYQTQQSYSNYRGCILPLSLIAGCSPPVRDMKEMANKTKAFRNASNRVIEMARACGCSRRYGI